MFMVIEQTMMDGGYEIADFSDQGFDTFEHALTAVQHWAKNSKWETEFEILESFGAVIVVGEPPLQLKLEGRARELAKGIREEGD